MILPGRLMPKRRISIRAPVRGQPYARGLRENSRKLRRNLIIKCRARFIRRNKYVIARARKLKLVNRSRAQGRRQLNGETMAGLVPVRTQGWERRVAPEVAGRTKVGPRLICIFDQQINFFRDVDVAPNTVLAGINRF